MVYVRFCGIFQRENLKEMVKDTVLKHLGITCWLPDIQILSVLSAPVITTSIFCIICLFIAPVIQADGPAKIYPVQAHAQCKEVPILPPLMGRNTPSMVTATMCWPRYCVQWGCSLWTDVCHLGVIVLFHFHRGGKPKCWKLYFQENSVFSCNNPKGKLGTYCNG